MIGGESRRQAVHAAMALWIAALPFLSHVQALALAGAAILVNWVILPLTGLDRRLRRDDGPFIDGIKLYPVAVLLLLVLFPLPAAAAGWAVMAIGDAASNVFGRRYGQPPFLGRDDRSVLGSVAFVACAAPAAAVAIWWTHAGAIWLRHDSATAPSIAALLLSACGAALAGALTELVPLPRWLDDNLPIALAAGASAAGISVAAAELVGG